jgi:hypothetical protein
MVALLGHEHPLLHGNGKQVPLMVECHGHHLLGVLGEQEELHLTRVQVFQSDVLTHWVDQLVLRKLLHRIQLRLVHLLIDRLLELIQMVVTFVTFIATEIVLQHVQLALDVEVLWPCVISKGMPTINEK